MLKRLAGIFGSRKRSNSGTHEDKTTGTDTESRELKMMLDAMPVNVMVCDPSDDYKISYINETSLNT